MFNGIRGGHNLFRVQDALAILADDPERLDHARSRFDGSPSQYRSPSGTTTRSPSPDLRTDEERWQEERLYELRREWSASLPATQFEADKAEERERICKNHDNRIRPLPHGDSWLVAELNVKQRWMEQGIWDDDSGWPENGTWKHEKPSPLKMSKEAPRSLFSAIFPIPLRHDGVPKQAELDAERARVAEERERQASRPLHQFIYHVSRKREHMQELQIAGQAPVSPEFDINTRAYNEVKSIWIKRGIWDAKWGILPGMTWKHEHSFKKLVRAEFGADYEPPSWPSLARDELDDSIEDKPLTPPPECNRPKEDEIHAAMMQGKPVFWFCAEPSEFVRAQLAAAQKREQREREEQMQEQLSRQTGAARPCGARPRSIFEGLFHPPPLHEQASAEADASQAELSTRLRSQNANDASLPIDPQYSVRVIRKSTRRQKRPADSAQTARENRKRHQSSNGLQEAGGRRKQPARACKRKPAARV
ncbi:hypothetical protein GGR57DRAFT_501255 [Xylariaceae sp. FL1272]|nr:hypothetical protein GGR57DRAFT_501255 [Xylariaceae sp. FL1272]